MPKRRTIYHHIALDAPTIVKDGENLKATIFKSGGTLIGRVLFTEPEPAVRIDGNNASVSFCEFDGAGLVVRGNTSRIFRNLFRNGNYGIRVEDAHA